MSDLTEIKQRMHKWIAKQATALHPYMPFGAIKTSDLIALLAEIERLTRERNEARAALASIAEGCSFPADDVQRAIRDRTRAALAQIEKEKANGSR